MYFDENNNFFYEDNDHNYNFKIDNIDFNNRNNELFSVEEGFNKGNVFKNLYTKYKNYVYKLNVNNKKDELLYKIQMYNFMQKDLNLYLDVNPDDQSIINEYLKIIKKGEEYKKEYENKYGPLCSSNSIDEDRYSWINNPWPWDKGGK